MFLLLRCFLFVVVLLPLISTASNDCSESLKSHILTCQDVDFTAPSNVVAMNPIEAQLSNGSVLLVLKNSKDLLLKPEYHTEAFQGLNSYQIISVQALQIAPYTFANLSTLEYVKICDNNYHKVLANTFHGLGKLRTLNLNNNSIHELEADAFNSLSSLETLELTHNDFKTLRRHLFASLASLKSLFLYHNNIEVLEDGCLEGLVNLSVLDLTYNRITKISAGMFNGMGALSQLYLSYNRIDNITGDFTLPRLEFLYLQNNRLSVVSDTTLSMLVSLRDLDISRNRISELSPLAFYNCTRLTNLNYKENNLKDRVEFDFADNSTSPLITV